MSLIERVINGKETDQKPIWLMRQAGRYLPEFRKIREKNPDFIKLCLNKDLVQEITLQPLKRFNIDAAIIFSDILMLPYGLGQSVEFEKNFGPRLGEFKDVNLSDISEDKFVEKLSSVYNSFKILSEKLHNKNKSLIGFTGAPWTILVYMLNKQSPKKELDDNLKNINENKKILKIIIKYLKVHIKNQIENGANIIQIFDSWAGLVEDKYVGQMIYEPNAELVEFVKSFNIPVICFPRETNNYNEFVNEVDPSVISLDYNVDIKNVVKNIKIPTQGNLDPSILLTNRDNIKKHTLNILENFKNHPHIFNLGHGVLPQTDPIMVDYLVNLVKDY